MIFCGFTGNRNSLFSASVLDLKSINYIQSVDDIYGYGFMKTSVISNIKDYLHFKYGKTQRNSTETQSYI